MGCDGLGCTAPKYCWVVLFPYQMSHAKREAKVEWAMFGSLQRSPGSPNDHGDVHLRCTRVVWPVSPLPSLSLTALYLFLSVARPYRHFKPLSCRDRSVKASKYPNFVHHVALSLNQLDVRFPLGGSVPSDMTWTCRVSNQLPPDDSFFRIQDMTLSK